jgi:peroxiredoxin Q/BCP
VLGVFENEGGDMKTAALVGLAVVLLVGFAWGWARSARADGAVPARVGQFAPDFTLKDQNGRPVTLSEFRGNRTVVLYFYPKDDTPGCTKEACSFRDDMARFEALNVRVLGVSVDGIESHRAFAEKYRLNFPLLSDEDHRVSLAYGVFSRLVGFAYAKRTTFVIGPDGAIRQIFTDVDPKQHAVDLLKYLNGSPAQTPSEG